MPLPLTSGQLTAPDSAGQSPAVLGPLETCPRWLRGYGFGEPHGGRPPESVPGTDRPCQDRASLLAASPRASSAQRLWHSLSTKLSVAWWTFAPCSVNLWLSARCAVASSPFVDVTTGFPEADGSGGLSATKWSNSRHSATAMAAFFSCTSPRNPRQVSRMERGGRTVRLHWTCKVTAAEDRCRTKFVVGCVLGCDLESGES